MPWTWERLLRNRPLDVWMHEQDVRRAVGLPGGLDSAPARHTADYLTESLDMVVGKRVAPAPGTTVVLEVAGSPARAVTVGDDGRARRSHRPATRRCGCGWTARTSSSSPAVGGRRPSARVEGDQELGHRVLGAFAVTP